MWDFTAFPTICPLNKRPPNLPTNGHLSIKLFRSTPLPRSIPLILELNHKSPPLLNLSRFAISLFSTT